MPKEIVHWTIAEIVRQNLPEGFIKKDIDNYYSEYLIGSIAFDIPYYNFSKKMTEIASSLHGKDKQYAETNYEKIWNYYKSQPDGLFSFIAGTVCHALTDINFHPLVFEYTNDNIHEHRKFETELDLFYLDKISLKTYSLKKLIKTIRTKEFYNFLSLFIFGDSNHKLQIKFNLIKYSTFQYLIRQKWFSILSELFKLTSLLTLCYGDLKPKKQEIFQKTLKYSLDKIEQNTISDILGILNQIETKKDFSILKFIPLSGKKLN